MPRNVRTENLRAKLGRELAALRESEEALYERLEYLEDSLAAVQAREDRGLAVPWAEVRE